jgi:hypothetical protein
MTIVELKDRPDLDVKSKLFKLHIQLREILNALRKKKLTESIVTYINTDIDSLNALPNGEQLQKTTKQKQTNILKLVEKELKIVPKNYYRNIWLPLGMSVFGLPLGAAFGLVIGNIGLLSVGLPIGMAIGVAVGVSLDKKALTEGRQLDAEVRY